MGDLIVEKEKGEKKESVDKNIELEEHLKRLQAEFENYKKRIAKENEHLTLNASASLIQKLLPTLEAFEAALSSEKMDKETEKGIKMVYESLVDVLKREGLEEMKDEKFDPFRHEVVRQVEGKEDGKIVEVIKKGYLLNGKILRHALVVITKKGDKK